MQGRQLLAAAGATAMLGLGISAAGAQGSPFEFDFGGVYTMSCNVSFAGSGGSGMTVNLLPSFDSCEFVGFPATVSQSGIWRLPISSGPSGGWYGGNFTVPSGTTTIVDVPLWACTVSMSGPQTASHGVGGTIVQVRNVTGGIELNLDVSVPLASASGGCPFSSWGSVGMSTGAPAYVPGVTVP